MSVWREVEAVLGKIDGRVDWFRRFRKFERENFVAFSNRD